MRGTKVLFFFLMDVFKSKLNVYVFLSKKFFLKMDLHRVCFIPMLCFSSSVSEVG